MGFFQKNPSILGEKRKQSIEYRQGLILKATRINQNLSLESVTEKVGLNDIDTLLKIEHGQFKNLQEEVQQVAKFLNVRLQYPFQKEKIYS